MSTPNSPHVGNYLRIRIFGVAKVLLDRNVTLTNVFYTLLIIQKVR